MTDISMSSGIGLTPRMKSALEAITSYVARHGAMPSRSGLAAAMGCNRNNANRLMTSLVERGEINSLTPGGALTGFGSGGIFVALPPHLVATLAAFCADNSERISAVVADAVALHLDQLAGAVDGV